jgi:hypothetical protein
MNLLPSGHSETPPSSLKVMGVGIAYSFRRVRSEEL